MKTANLQSLIVVLIVCLGSLQNTQAVSPPPDGGYPGYNTAEGQNALLRLNGGTYNTAVGADALFANVTGTENTAVGALTLLFNTAGQNTGTGAAALLSNTIGAQNTANGAFALFNNTIGAQNTAVGFQALFNATGGGNTAIGSQALLANTTGVDNTALGLGAGSNVTTASNVICIGAAGNNVDNSCYIGQIFGATSSNGVGVFVNSNGRLGTMTSSRRFKERIRPMGDASEALFSLEPVTFRYKKGVDPEGPQGKSQFGLVAEDVDKVNPDLAVRDKEGKPYSVRYDQVNAMLLNEFLKEHKAFVAEQHNVENLRTIVAQQQKQIDALTAGLQKVSAQLEVSKAAPQTVLNGQ
jgi:hypothetical protein